MSLLCFLLEDVTKPIVVRMRGTNAKEATELLDVRTVLTVTYCTNSIALYCSCIPSFLPPSVSLSYHPFNLFISSPHLISPLSHLTPSRTVPYVELEAQDSSD